MRLIRKKAGRREEDLVDEGMVMQGWREGAEKNAEIQ